MIECTLEDSERQPCEIWTRVMGYFRPVNHFNEGKKSEYGERKWFLEKKLCQMPQKRLVA